MTPPRFVPYASYREYPPDEMLARATALREELQRRRTVRAFSDRRVPRAIIEQCLLTAGTAPSGANLQPWHFVAVGDPAIKRSIRAEAEREERAFYHGRAPREWLQLLEPLGTDEHKPYLEAAPWLIAVFAQVHGVHPDGSTYKHYYVQESVGIAVGLLIAALHHAGLATLTHTPSPMGFLREVLGRPAHERPVMLVVAGYPHPDAQVPEITKKSLEEIATFR
jgi:nitroreductase